VVPLVEIDRARPAPDADPSAAVDAIDALGYRLLAQVAAAEAAGTNVVISPTSVAIALALMEPGTVGDATDQLHQLLAIDDPAALHAAMGALEAHLGSLAVTDDDGGELVIQVADAAYLQQGYPFEASYLETIGTHHGPVLYAVDYRSDPDAVADEINRFVADATRDRIPELIGPGVLDIDTVLTLVNALYLKASWLEPFEPEGTEAAAATAMVMRATSAPMDSVPVVLDRPFLLRISDPAPGPRCSWASSGTRRPARRPRSPTA
jgi:serpin B